jgi:hypothetical protein
MKGYIVLIILILIISLLSGCKEKEIESYQFELVALNNNNNIYGSFFLGSGSIKEEQYFFAYVKYDDGGIKLWKCEAYTTWIYEDIINNQTPYIIYTESYSRGVNFYSERHEFHIPKGSILQKFNLN